MEIQKMLFNYLEKNKTYGIVNGSHILSLFKVLNNTKEDFLIYKNGGDIYFHIIFDNIDFNIISKQDQFYPVKNEIIDILHRLPKNVICYQINNKQYIINKI